VIIKPVEQLATQIEAGGEALKTEGKKLIESVGNGGVQQQIAARPSIDLHR
jgi:hypothetical protein